MTTKAWQEMSVLERMAKNAYFTLAPGLEKPATCGATRFRWGFHVSLPFTLPSRTCVHERIKLGTREYEYALHNHLDRLTLFPGSQTTWPSVHLITRTQVTPKPRQGLKCSRETLQSVASFVDVVESSTPSSAFENAAEKVKECFKFLSQHLAELQGSMPYLSSWQIYPISQFDIGLVYHTVEHFCPPKNKWDHYNTGVTINVTRQLHQPLNLSGFPTCLETGTPVDLSNELLAEAQVSLFRALTRSAVINSYQAVETLANVVFKLKWKDKLISEGKSPGIAESEAEELRKDKRLKYKFLLNDGLHAACGKSLLVDDANKYNEICKAHEFRNQVAHAGVKPTTEEAERVHLLCCEVVQWLCSVGGFPIRPLLPDLENVVNELIVLPSDINAIPNAAKAFLLRMLGEQPNEELFATPCQFGLKVGVNSSALRKEQRKEKVSREQSSGEQQTEM